VIRAFGAFIVVWLALGASAAQADYWGRWDRVGGGWSTGWIRHTGDANVCGHYHQGCRCGNVCGAYPNGAVTTWWPYGCNREMWQIRCSIRPISQPGGGQRVRINHPRIQGAIVDWCASWATNCGAGGAHQYCRSIGYSSAADWSTFTPGRTWVMGSNRYCQAPNCAGFQHVTCVR